MTGRTTVRRALTKEERARFSRQIIVPGIGESGQLALADAAVLVIGAGGLGTPVLEYLAGAGVGELGIVDGDRVEVHNLQRQVIHTTSSIGSLKVESAAHSLRALNPRTVVKTWAADFISDNALDIARGFDIIVDCTDRFETRYLSSDVCETLDLGHVWGAIFQFEGYVGSSSGHASPMYRDIFPEEPAPAMAPTCSAIGVVGAICGVVGSLMAHETIALACGVPREDGRMLEIDLSRGEFDALRYERDSQRPIPTIDSLRLSSVPQTHISHAEAASLLKNNRNEFVLIDVRTADERDSSVRTTPVHIPFDTLLRMSSAGWDTNVRPIFACATGGRAKTAAKHAQETLQVAGALSVEGSITDVLNAMD